MRLSIKLLQPDRVQVWGRLSDNSRGIKGEYRSIQTTENVDPASAFLRGNI